MKIFVRYFEEVPKQTRKRLTYLQLHHVFGSTGRSVYGFATVQALYHRHLIQLSGSGHAAGGPPQSMIETYFTQCV